MNTLNEIDFFAADVLRQPFAANALARRQAPVYKVPGQDLFMVFTYELIEQVLMNPAVFSSKNKEAMLGRSILDPKCQAIYGQGWPQVETLLTNDPPSHTRFRKLVNTAFAPARVNKMEAHILQRVDQLIDDFIDAGQCEFVQAFAMPLPCTIIAEQMGVPLAEVPQVKQWADAFIQLIGNMLPHEEEMKCARMVVDFQHYVKGKLDERRDDPQDDLLTALVHARADDERPLDEAELLNVAQQLIVAGNATTTHTLAGGMLMLIQHPQQLKKAKNDPGLIKNMVEEILRMETPTNSMWRMAREDTVLGGVAIPAGSRLLLRFGSANRDETRFVDAEKFDIARQFSRPHMAFGKGIHTCIGAMLARKEINCAFRRIFTRMDNIRLQQEKPLPQHFPNILLRGIEELHIAFDKPA